MKHPAADPAPRRTLAKKVIIAIAMICVAIWLVLLVRLLAGLLNSG